MILTCNDIELDSLIRVLDAYKMKLNKVACEQSIPASFWGGSEAGLIRNTLYIRSDTPVHSALHETCHYVCMDQSRRDKLHTDAQGSYDEENAVNYLQILLSDLIPGCGKDAMFRNMDQWGYSFRLGSAKAWFELDGDDAHLWLSKHGLIDENNSPTWRLRNT